MNLSLDTPVDAILDELVVKSLTERILKVFGLARVSQLGLTRNIYESLKVFLLNSLLLIKKRASQILELYGKTFQQMNLPTNFNDMYVMALFPLRILQTIVIIQRNFVELTLASGNLFFDEILPDLKETTAFALSLYSHYKEFEENGIIE